jgi:hypothetical protein
MSIRTKADAYRTPGREVCLDHQKSTGVVPEDAKDIHHQSHFGSARVVVWALIFEGALVIAISVRWWLPDLVRSFDR